MFGSLGLPELLFIFGLALLIFGPRKLPEIGRTIGRGLAEFRKASTDLKRSLNAEMIEEELRESDPRKALRGEPPDEPQEPAAAASGPPDPATEDAGVMTGGVSRGSLPPAGAPADADTDDDTAGDADADIAGDADADAEIDADAETAGDVDADVAGDVDAANGTVNGSR